MGNEEELRGGERIRKEGRKRGGGRRERRGDVLS